MYIFKDINAALTENPADSGAQGTPAQTDALLVRAYAWVGRFVLVSGSSLRLPTRSGGSNLTSFGSSLRAQRSNLTSPGFILNVVKDILLTLCTLHLARNTSYADTTFVSGAVSGEWTPEESPYIQVGAANVPQGQSLTIRPGVEVVLSQQAAFVINGSLEAVGTAEDSIRIQPIDTGLTSTILFDGTSLQMMYCRLDSFYQSIKIQRGSIIIANCFFYDDEYPVVSIRGDLRFDFHDNTVLRPDNGRSTLAIGQPDTRGKARIINNQMPRTSVNGSCLDSIMVTDNTIYGARINDCIWMTVQNNYSENQVTIQNLRGNFQMRFALFEGNDIGYRLVWNVPSPAVPIIRNNRIATYMTLDNGEYFVESNTTVSGFNLHRTRGRFIRNLATSGGVLLHDASNVELTNNTFIEDGSNRAPQLVNASAPVREGDYQERGENRVTLRNNILMNLHGGEYIVSEFIEVNGRNNCLWGAEQPYGGREDLLNEDVFDNPLMRAGLPYSYRLRADSHCIDAGDPNSPRDPDGTRADIGCFYFDQQNGEPPALNRKWDYYIGWNETFTYTVRAVDERGELTFDFQGLPEWLEIDQLRRDYVEDSVVVSGVVPEEEEDFVFNVIARDEQDREDTLSVRVMVYPYRVLTGIVRGTLDIAQSPFIVADTAWVPAGDSLVLPPGTELYFDNREDTLTGRNRSTLMVAGILKAVGTVEDSITFTAFDTSRSNRGLRFEDNDDGYSEFRFCKFENTDFDYSSRKCNILVNNCLINQSSIRAGGFTIRTTVENNIGGSISISGKATIRENLRTGLSFWLPDSVEISNNDLGTVWLRFGQSDIIDYGYITMHHNSIRGDLHTTSGGDTGNDTIIIRDNHFEGVSESVQLMGDNYVEFSNNLVSGGDESLNIYPNDRPTKVFNNVFTNAGTGIKAYYWRDYPEEFRRNLQIEKNVFINIDTLIQVNRNHINGLRYNSFFGIGLWGNDSTFSTRLTRLNANGDSCDANFNLYSDPQIVNSDSLDFHLFAGSPLINAGNPDSTFFDLDGSVNDIGPYGGPNGESYDYPVGVGVSKLPAPLGFALGEPFPNPFNSITTIRYSLPEASSIKLGVYDLSGREIATLATGNRLAGVYSVVWSAEGVGSGLYFVRLEVGAKTFTQKMILVK